MGESTERSHKAVRPVKPIRKNLSEANATSIIDELEHVQEVIESEIKNGADSIVEVEISKILSPKYHDRRSHDKKAIVDLSKSIQTVGLIYPVVLRKTDVGLERIIGYRRIEASKLLDKKLIKSIILENISDEMAILLMTTENMQREGVSVYDETLAVIDYIKAATGLSQEQLEKLLYRFKNNNAHKTDLTADEKKQYHTIDGILKKTGKIDVSGLLNRLNMLSMHDLIKEALSQNRLSFSNAQILQKLSNDEDSLRLAMKRVEEEGSSKRETARIVADYLAIAGAEKKETAVKALSDKLKTIKAKSIYRLSPEKREQIEMHINDIVKLMESDTIVQ